MAGSGEQIVVQPGEESGSTKLCRKCGVPKAVSEFPREVRNRDGLYSWCKKCASAYVCARQNAHPEKVKRTKYGIDFNALWSQQMGLCAVCGKPMLPKGKELTSVVVDHDRNCCSGNKSCGKCVRGLIHNQCNRILGMARDNEDLLQGAAAYVARWRAGLQ